MKIATIIGARPQFIKAAVVSRAVENHNSNCGDNSTRIQEIIVHTGQHYDRNMSAVFFEEMQIPRSGLLAGYPRTFPRRDDGTDAGENREGAY